MNNFGFLTLVLSLSLFSYPIIASDHDDSDDEEQKSIQLINGQPVIFLDQEAQTVSGIKTKRLKPVEYQPEYISFGETIDLTEILTIHYQFFTADLQKHATLSRINQIEKSISRLKMLHKNEAISSQKLYSQQLQSESEKAIYAAANHQSKNIINQSKQKWGSTLTQWATTKNSNEFNQLMEGSQTLLQVSLPPGKTLSTDINQIYISASGERINAIPAHLISPTSIVHGYSQGLKYFFLSDSKNLKPGMRVTAWIAEKSNKQTGIMIPESAIIRHLGQAIVFLKIDEQHFLHKNIDQLFKVAQGYFIEDPSIQNNEIVVSGAQMLLSHEFRSQIPDEDDDD